MTKTIDIFTDGACSGNPGMGGWGAVLKYKDTTKTLSGFAENTTNNQMELTATIEAIKVVKTKCNINLTTDSSYVKDGITKWIYNWQKNNWKTANKKPVKNKELWQDLLEQTKNHDITWYWVKGHAGHPENELADELAVAEILKYKGETLK